MKVTVWGINYSPELTGIAPYNTALCSFLRERGHEVHMVTTFAYYPAWRKLASERFSIYRTDNLSGVNVHRCWHYVPRRLTTLKRIVHEGTFVLMSLWRQWDLPRPDVLVVVSPPLLLGAAAWFLGKLKKTPFIFHVQDLQPDAAAGLGMLKNSWFLRLLYGLEKFAYRKAARVGAITPRMLQSFREKEVPTEKQFYFPNPVVLPDLSRLPDSGQFRRRHAFAKDDFLVVYSGNLGVKQGLDILFDAARLVLDRRVRFVICGEGGQREHLLGLLREYKLTNVVMLPLQPEQLYHQLLVDANLCVITQQLGSGGCFFPSKLLTTLAWARPVLTVAEEESELVRALKKGEFGINIAPGKPERLAEILTQLADQPEWLEELGQSGRKFVEQFEINSVLSQVEMVLQQVARHGRDNR